MKKILWFIKGDISAEHVEKAHSNGLTIRSLDAYRDGDFVESCEGVCGDFPQTYSDFEEFSIDSAIVEYAAPKTKSKKSVINAAGVA